MVHRTPTYPVSCLFVIIIGSGSWKATFNRAAVSIRNLRQIVAGQQKSLWTFGGVKKKKKLRKKERKPQR